VHVTRWNLSQPGTTTLTVELEVDSTVLWLRVTDGPGPKLSVARAEAERGHWRVRAMCLGREAIVGGVAEAREWLLEDLHSLFAGHLTAICDINEQRQSTSTQVVAP